MPVLRLPRCQCSDVSRAILDTVAGKYRLLGTSCSRKLLQYWMIFAMDAFLSVCCFLVLSNIETILQHGKGSELSENIGIFLMVNT